VTLALSILDCLDDERLLGGAFVGESRRPWWGFLGAVFGLPMPDDLGAFARACNQR
jgi:hypothetical protein